jgi:nicotinate-nucleotide pyrophosphorylase (carboxylating)
MPKKDIDFPKHIDRLSENFLTTLIELAVHEDLNGIGDITTNSIFKGIETHKKQAKVIAKERGIVCGVELFERVYAVATSSIATTITILKQDGDLVHSGDIILKIEGNSTAITTGERVAINFLGLLSGVATRVNYLTNLIKHTSTRLLDTRKTIPGMRELQKYAVQIGGGHNHRLGLYDMILIKENHIRTVGGIKKAVELARSEYPQLVVEVETASLTDVEEALQTDADILMLDNMDNAMVGKALTIIDSEKWVEVSGNVDEQRLIELAEIGVDFVSMGELTHTIKPLDVSLLIIE